MLVVSDSPVIARLGKILAVSALSTLALLPLVGCEGGRSVDALVQNGQRLANNSNPDIRTVPASAILPSHSASPGCPSGVTVTYLVYAGTSTRDYEGGSNHPGLCYQRQYIGGVLQTVISVAGMAAGNKMADPQRLADNILPVILGKSPSVTFNSVGSLAASETTFSYEKNKTAEILVGDQLYTARTYKYLVKISYSNQIEESSDNIWLDNPKDPEAPIFYGSAPNEDHPLYAYPSTTASKINFNRNTGSQVAMLGQ